MSTPNEWVTINQTMDDRVHPTCDFCGAAPMAKPCRAYPASAFWITINIPGYGELTQEFMGDGWCACANCWPHVEKKSLNGLIKAYTNEHPISLEDAEIRDFGVTLLLKAWRMFFERQTGPGIDHDPDSGVPMFPAVQEG